MEETLRALEAYGFDREQVMERFVDDQEFYLDCCSQVLHDPAFDELDGLLRSAGEDGRAFDCAHSLKGILSNVGLVRLFDCVSQLVEILRGTKEGDVWALYRELLRLREECLALF